MGGESGRRKGVWGESVRREVYEGVKREGVWGKSRKSVRREGVWGSECE